MANATGGTPRPDLARLRIDESQRGRRPIGRGVVGALAVVAVLVAAAGAVSLLRDRAVQVTVAAAEAPGGASDARVTLLNASGYVTPRRRATVAAKITGKVTGVYIDEGVRVHQGQLLAQLDDSDYRAALATAQADRNATAAGEQQLRVELTNARRELARTQGLVQAGIQTQEALDTAQTAVASLVAQIAATGAQVKAADARIAQAEQNIANCRVLAPFTGMVVTKDAQPGEMVSPISAGGGYTRTGIATIVDMASLEIEVDVNENYIARVVAGQPVTATLDAYPDWQIPGHVRAVIPTADREKGNGEGAGHLRPARSPHPAGHGREGRLPRPRSGGDAGRRGDTGGRPRAGRRRPHGGRPADGLPGARRGPRAPGRPDRTHAGRPHRDPGRPVARRSGRDGGARRSARWTGGLGEAAGGTVRR